MKNIRFYLSGPVLVVLLTMMFCTAALAETLYVQNEKADIREGKGAFFPVVYTVSKAEALTVVQREGSWLKVDTPNGPGWIYEKALAAKKPKSGGILAGAADTSELDKTAGFKGFDEPTERAYISKNKLQAQMRQIDQMEMPPFTPAELRNFQLKGRVGPLGGGR